MKKIILFAFIIIAFTTSFLTADDTIMKNVAITADFNFPFFDEFNLKADIKIIPELSIGPNLALVDYTTSPNNFHMIGIGGNIRYFWQGTAVHGYYFGEVINYYTYTVYISGLEPYTAAPQSGTSSGNAIEYSTLVGYQSIWEGGFVLDIAFGYQFIVSKSTYTMVSFVNPQTGPSSEPYAVNHLFIYRPFLKIGIGYAF